VARVLGFVVPLTAGEAISLSALANHTGYPWMIHAIIAAMIATFGFLVAMLMVRAIDSYTGGSNTPYVVAERFRRYATTSSADENGA
jgi:Na+-translocating ferredoxin:NAD+ oxidoreductase RnfA subunit